MTIAPAAPAEPAAAALLHTLNDLTADLPDADPGPVVAAVLRGRQASAGEAELRALAIEAAAGLIGEEPDAVVRSEPCADN